jgi:hypothetical protein
VAVEKFDLSRLAQKLLLQEALQATFWVFLDIFYPPNFGCFEENGVFQQPQAFALIDLDQSATPFSSPSPRADHGSTQRKSTDCLL